MSSFLPESIKKLLRPYLAPSRNPIQDWLWYWSLAIKKPASFIFERPRTPFSKKIVLVGNSPALLNAELGKTIDRFDLVIRINDFKTEGFENDTGTRFDVWALATGPANLKKIVASPALYLQHAQKAQKIIVTESHAHLAELLKIPENKLESAADLKVEAEKILGVSPTTGFLTLLYIKRHYADGEILLAGIASKKSTGRGHYFDTQHRHWPGHNFWREAALISLLEKNGVLKKLEN